MFNVSDKIKLNSELCPVDKLADKHFQFGALNYPVLMLDWEMEVVDAFTDQYHGAMLAFKVLNDERVEAETVVYMRAEDAVISKETKLKIDYQILGKMLKVQPLIDLNRGQHEELLKVRAELKKTLPIKAPELQANWKEVQALQTQYKKIQEQTETVFVIKTPKLGTFELDCKEDQIETMIRREIRKSRAEAKKITSVEKVISGNIKYEKVGGVLSKPGEIAKISKDFAIKIINEPKKPTTKEDNFVGIEIECFGPLSIEEMKGEFIKAGLKKFVNITTDSSIRPGESLHAMEIRVCIAEKDLAEILPKIFEVIENTEMEANASCGTHVHIDMRNRNPELAYSNFFKAQKLMLATQPKTRRTNTYCKPNVHPELKLEQFKTNERYSVINTQAYHKNDMKTIEIRLHSGTVKLQDIKAWINFLVAIASKSDKLTKEVATVKDLELLETLDVESVLHISKRVKKYA